MLQSPVASTNQSETSQFFVPKVSKPGITLRISLSLVEDLGFEAIEGLKSVPKRGLEIGGILLGQWNAARTEIEVEAHEPVESEHLHGPSWLLSPRDRTAFRDTINGIRNQSSQQLRPVGFYRSQTRDGLGFDEQDNALMREMFGAGPAICLLVKPAIAEPSVSRIGMVTEGVLQPVAMFPFHAGVLREGDYQIFEGMLPLASAVEPSAVAPAPEPPPALRVTAPEAIRLPRAAIPESLSPPRAATPEPVPPPRVAISEPVPPPHATTPEPLPPPRAAIPEPVPPRRATTPEPVPPPRAATPEPLPPPPAARPPQPIAETVPFIPEPARNPVLATKKSRRIPLTATLLATGAAILICAFLVARYRADHEAPPSDAVTAAAPPVADQAPAQPAPNPPAPNPPEATPILNNAILLDVKRGDGTATLSWNREAPAVKNADHAQLLITDGRSQEQLHLDRQQLDAGRLVYLPRNRDISFKMQLVAESGSTTESIRSVADRSPTPPTAATPASPSETARLPRTERPPVAAPEPTREASETPEVTPPVVVQQPTVQPATPPPAAQPSQPPPASAEATAPKPTPFAAQSDKTPAKPREPEVVTTVSLELLGPSGLREALGALSPRRIFGFRSADKLTPPRIVKQILPGIYPGLAARIRDTRLIDVKITVGASGHVVDTELEDGPAADPVDSAVYYAARQWTFEPAHDGNRAVESKVLMHFVLKRAS